MEAVKVRTLEPTEVLTGRDFEIRPLRPRRSTVVTIGPWAPGAIFQGCSGSLASVQPQARVRLSMITAWVEMFVT